MVMWCESLMWSNIPPDDFGDWEVAACSRPGHEYVKVDPKKRVVTSRYVLCASCEEDMKLSSRGYQRVEETPLQ